MIRLYANPGRLSPQRQSSTTNANAGPLTGLVGLENHSYLGVGADTEEEGIKNSRLGQKSRQMPDYKGFYTLSILCNDFL